MSSPTRQRASVLVASSRLTRARAPKFGNRIVVVSVDGRIYPIADARRLQIPGDRCDSLGEAQHLLLLRERARRGTIRDLRHPHTFELCVAGVKIGELRADFSFIDAATGQLVVHDFKGRHNKSTDVEYRFFRWKTKHLKAQSGIDVIEVHAPSSASAREQWRQHVSSR